MFNSYTVNPILHVEANVSNTTHEHRAPTDESIRLMREMETKAKDQVVKAVRVENSHIDTVIHTMRDTLTGDTLYAVIFKINGVQHRVDHRQSSWGNVEETIVKIRDAVAIKIANDVVSIAIKDIRHA